MHGLMCFKDDDDWLQMFYSESEGERDREVIRKREERELNERA